MKAPKVARYLIIAGGIGALVAVAGFFAYRYWVFRAIKREALALGVVISSVDSFHLTKDAIELDGVTFSLDGVPGSSGTAKVVKTGLARPPKKVTLEGVDLAFAGRAGVWLTAVSKWSRAHADVFDLALSATNVGVTAHEGDGDASWLSLSNATLTTRGKDLRLDAKDGDIIGLHASPVALTWPADGSHASVAIGGDGPNAPLHAEVRPIADGAQIELTVAPTPIADLATRLHLDIASRAKVTAHGTVTMHGSGAFEGDAEAAVDGWIPAHPHELDGILYGNKTRATVSFKTSGEEGANVELNPLHVVAGALDMRGAGTIARGGKHLGHLKIDLQGSLPCSQVARSAGADMGGVMGGVISFLGEHAASGNVAIHVRAQGELTDLKNIAITHDEKSGCSLGL